MQKVAAAKGMEMAAGDGSLQARRWFRAWVSNMGALALGHRDSDNSSSNINVLAKMKEAPYGNNGS